MEGIRLDLLPVAISTTARMKMKREGKERSFELMLWLVREGEGLWHGRWIGEYDFPRAICPCVYCHF